MSMSSEPENFEALRRLLAIKRHEQPPPGYFNSFSRQVILRIQAAEAEPTSWGRCWFGSMSWLHNLWGSLEAKPIVAGAFGVGVCGLLVVGLISSERIDADSTGFAATPQTPTINLANVPSQNIGSSFLDRGVGVPAGTSSVYQVEDHSSMFDEIQRPHVQPVTYSVAH